MKFTVLDPSFIDQLIPLALELNPRLHPDLLAERFKSIFEYSSYTCFGMLDEERFVKAMAGAWTSTRLYSGKQLELDNVVVHPDLRSQGLGARFQKELEDWCMNNGYESIELNTYVANRKSHRFYLREGYDIYGFHCIKRLNSGIEPHS